jgi:hypothetical protein
MILIPKERFDETLVSHSVRQSSNASKHYEWNDYSLILPEDTELIAFFSRTKNRGVIFTDTALGIHTLSFEISKKAVSKSGTTKPSICDLCFTQRSNGDVRYISFYRADIAESRQRPISWLCCVDLLCSAHVRNMTHASLISRAQLRETELNKDNQQIPLGTEAMITRLRKNTLRLVSTVNKD